MKIEKLINHLGCSIKSESFDSIIKELKISTELRDYHKQLERKSLICLRNELDDIVLVFDGYRTYKSKYGEPKTLIDPLGDELILTQIWFYNEDEHAKAPFSIMLPFGLAFKDSLSSILLKVGKKPYWKNENEKGYYLLFKMDEFELGISLNRESQLMDLKILNYDKDDLSKIRLKKELNSQRKNIKPENIDLLKSLIERVPTTEWRKRMEEGDDLFTDKNIGEVENVLKEYIKTISEYTELKKVTKIYNSVKKVVKKINKINDSHDHFIDTMEREELCVFIDEIIETTGFVIKDGIDLTEDWREW